MPTLVIIPTYNEKENIIKLADEVLGLSNDIHVLVVDDNSPDGTGKMVEEAIATRSRLHILHRAAKLGLGTAYKAGYTFALENGYDRVITMDADFSHQPQYIPQLIDKNQFFDISIGSRYVPGGGTKNWGPHRKLISFTANFLARTLLGLTAHDCTAGFRCYRSELLQKVDYQGIKSEGYSFLVEMLFTCVKKGAQVGEIPIIFENRVAGKSKISKKEIYMAILTLLRLAFHRGK
jgi:glycosyltransferase involved in cell wall biosynthesis